MMGKVTIELPNEAVRRLEVMAAASGYQRAEDYFCDALIAAAKAAGPSLREFELHLFKAMQPLPQGEHRPLGGEGSAVDRP